MDINSIGELVSFLEELPPTDDIEFVLKIGRKISTHPSSLEDYFSAILTNSQYEIELRFRAFYGLVFHHRRQNNHTRMREIISRYIEEFINYNLYYHLKALMFKTSGNKQDLLKSVELSRLAVEKLIGNVGVVHNYCETVVLAMEEKITVPDQHIKDAKSYIDMVITLSPHYAKYYCTKARFLSQLGHFEEAKQNAEYAIDLEDNTLNDYSMRLIEYKNHLSQIKTMELFENVKTVIEGSKKSILMAEESIKTMTSKTKDQLEDMKAQNLQMLAFFTAIISFIIGSINILSKQPTFMDSSMLILILAGTMILANVGFSILLRNVRQSTWKYVIVMVIGVFMISAGIFIRKLM